MEQAAFQKLNEMEFRMERYADMVDILGTALFYTKTDMGPQADSFAVVLSGLLREHQKELEEVMDMVWTPPGLKAKQESGGAA